MTRKRLIFLNAYRPHLDVSLEYEGPGFWMRQSYCLVAPINLYYFHALPTNLAPASERTVIRHMRHAARLSRQIIRSIGSPPYMYCV